MQNILFRSNSNATSWFHLNMGVVLLFLVFNLHFISSKVISRANNEASKLTFVAIVHRHGDRAPSAPYPNDPHANYSWPGGFGALSRKGAFQLYNLGKQLRTRYKRLLPPDGFYSKDNMRVQSSYLERCQMSVESLLAAFMPPHYDWFLSSRLPLPWQPVPINVLPPKEDYMLFQLKAPCPKNDALFNKFLTDPDPQTDFYEFNQRMAGLYEYLTENMGVNITRFQQVSFMQDTLAVEFDNGLELPAWTHPIFPDVLQGVKERGFQLYTETPYMTRIRGGPLLTDIFEQMVQKQSGNLTRNIAIYSAHDSTISALLKALNVIDQTTYTPEYGAAVALELHCSRSQECNVKALYDFNTYRNKPEQLKIPGCPGLQPCSLKEFGQAISDKLIYNITAECEI